jgi:transposase-like protein
MRGLTKNVKQKIAFEVFTTNKTHMEIATEFGVARPTVSRIAGEFKLQRTATKGPGRPLGSKSSNINQNDIDTVNWTFDDKLIEQRIKRREKRILNEVQGIINTINSGK